MSVAESVHHILQIGVKLGAGNHIARKLLISRHRVTHARSKAQITVNIRHREIGKSFKHIFGARHNELGVILRLVDYDNISVRVLDNRLKLAYAVIILISDLGGKSAKVLIIRLQHVIGDIRLDYVFLAKQIVIEIHAVHLGHDSLNTRV